MPQLPIGDIGPCEVTWDYGGANPVIITPHLGKVSLRMSDAVTDVHIDGQGVAPVESFFEGATLEFEVPMARSTLSQLANTIGYRDLGTLVGNILTLYNVAGIEMSAQAKMIVIKPLCVDVPNPDPNTWTVLFKCYPYRDFELGWDRAGQRVHMVKFKVFPDSDNGDAYLQEGAEIWCDDFCDVSLDAAWTTHGLDANKTITLNNTPPCWATISIINGVEGRWWCNNAAWNLCPKMYVPLGIIGPCRITTKLRSYTVNDDTQAGIFIGTHPTTPGAIGTNYAYVFGRHRDDSAALSFKYRVQTNCSSFHTDDGGVPYLPVWLRIQIDAAQDIRFKYSQDGIAWQPYIERGEAPAPDVELVISGYDIPNCFVGLHAKNIEGNTNIAAPFEYFCIESFL